MTLLNIKVEGAKGIVEGKFDEILDIVKARRLLRDAVDDIADAVEQEVQRIVPEETGTLKLHPIDRDDTRVGVTTDIAAFGGGISIRGARGRFTGAVPRGLGVGQLIARSVLTLPTEPKHAIWVHDGTGIYGPRKALITPRTAPAMVFPRWSKAISNRAIFVLKTVKGQKPQPYLTNAYLLINRTYIPARIELLRAQIAAET